MTAYSLIVEAVGFLAAVAVFAGMVWALCPVVERFDRWREGRCAVRYVDDELASLCDEPEETPNA